MPPSLLLPFLAGAAAAATAIPPLDPVVIEVPEAVSGPPALACRDALALAREDRDTRPPVAQPTTTAPRPPSGRGAGRASGETGAPAEEDREVIDIGRTLLEQLPGAHPDELPPRPFEGDDVALAAIGAVMRRAEAGERVRLSFWGASHTAGDFFTGTIRRELQARHGDLGHGFILPAAPFAGYRGHDVNLCRTDGWRADWVGRRGGRADGLYGFAGVSVSSADPADFGWIETTRDNPQGRRVSRYDIFTLAQPAGGTLLVTVDEAPPRAIATAASAVHMQWHRVVVPDGPHRLTVRPLGDGEVRIFGISAERDGPGVLVDAMGVRGRTARTWLRWDPVMAAQGMRALDPDLVVLAYGTNEAADTSYGMDAYRADLNAVLGRLREALPGAACLLVGPSDRGQRLDDRRYAVWPRTQPVAQVQREVAPRYGCAFWDWQQATGGPGSMIAWRLLPEHLAGRDLIHFTPAGYARSAEMFLAALDQVTVETAPR